MINKVTEYLARNGVFGKYRKLRSEVDKVIKPFGIITSGTLYSNAIYLVCTTPYANYTLNTMLFEEDWPDEYMILAHAAIREWTEELRHEWH